MDEQNEPHRPIRWLPILFGVLAALAVVSIVTGRLLDAPRYGGWQDAAYSVLLGFTVDGTFLGPQNPLTAIGGFLAALATSLAVAEGLMLLFRDRIRRWFAARSRGHVVIVGDGPDAVALARQAALTQRVVLVSPLEAPRTARLIRIEAAPRAAVLLAAAGVARAKAVAILLQDEKINASLAMSLAGPDSGPPIWCRIGDRLIADRVTAAAPAGRVRILDEAEATARDSFARHPAHGAAVRMGADRVHLLVAGFGRLGQAMAEAAIFSGIAEGLGKPMITVLDRDAKTAEALYRASRPALDLAADFAFMDVDLVTAAVAPGLAAPVFEALAARDGLAPVTAIALCLPRDEDNVRLALALPELRRREGRYFAPTFSRVRDADAFSVALSPARPVVVDPDSGVIPLAGVSGAIAAEVIDAAERDAAAQRLHEEGYKRSGRSLGAAGAWASLPETYRRANRRGADHLAAKLFSLGLVSERDPHQPIRVEAADYESRVAPLLRGEDAPTMEMLAALEHRRWNAERAIEGWAPGPVRDDDRRIHPLLLAADYAALPEVERQKDRDQVLTLLGSLVAETGKGSSRELRVALAGHLNIAPAELTRASAVLVDRLGRTLLEAGGVVALISPLAPGGDLAATEAMAAALSGKVKELRLILPEGVPYRVVLEEAARALPDDEARATLIAETLRRRAALFAKFARVDIVRTGLVGASDDSYRRNPDLFRRGAARANAYMARNADLVGVLWDEQPARGLGGLGDLVDYVRHPASIPADLDVRARSRTPGQLFIVPVSR